MTDGSSGQQQSLTQMQQSVPKLQNTKAYVNHQLGKVSDPRLTKPSKIMIKSGDIDWLYGTVSTYQCSRKVFGSGMGGATV
jgi:hypothetical protein